MRSQLIVFTLYLGGIVIGLGYVVALGLAHR